LKTTKRLKKIFGRSITYCNNAGVEFAGDEREIDLEEESFLGIEQPSLLIPMK
jgi:hypothetical protein